MWHFEIPERHSGWNISWRKGGMDVIPAQINRGDQAEKKEKRWSKTTNGHMSSDLMNIF